MSILDQKMIETIQTLRLGGAKYSKIQMETGLSQGTISKVLIRLGMRRNEHQEEEAPAVRTCIGCGVSASVPGLKRCQACIDEQRARWSAKPCVRCGKEGRRGKAMCQECSDARSSAGANRAPCKVCGKERPKSRWGCVTCSVECQVEIKRRVDALARREWLCKECGSAIIGDRARFHLFCSDECRTKAKERKAVVKPCSVCGKPCPNKNRSTCSDECRKESVLRSSQFGARSDSKRASRRKAQKLSYKGKDKAQLIEELTAKQGGKCKVCGHTGFALGNGKIGLVLDHCHRTGKARAMLCAKCNAALGLMGESKERIQLLADYAKAFSQASLLDLVS